ncbi:amidohydrolase [Mycobacteroides abscessus subsp. abscessus]|nr:amidohydrolase [Mycobacteroides abscessus subsp. abscessus]SHU50345.1 amidohydrolase [Mycobacteroides abscessus subsp. abscessus]SIG29945.1 amidohydrolase [Mycobacteroides abscessus subsp. abscessus]SII67177.1 amidohydrolase [Mycobacteroides abscessus subsp. abscessus]SKP09686.1 amidohydrolase [Mycobacteroides abscessus subsp. abscessus]
MVLAAAIQLEAVIGDVAANLGKCAQLAAEAGRAGAKIIALPEFFTTGIAFDPALRDAALPPEGAATELLRTLAHHYDALVGGSFLCRDKDGHVRNAYFAADATGMIGRHDKDLPTMWENAFYIGGQDDGVFRAGTLNVGAAVCWELMRTRTARRMRAHVDLVMAGSGWWSIPPWRPRATFAAMERRNHQTARAAAATFAKYVGAPVVHAPRTSANSAVPCPGSPSNIAATLKAPPSSPTVPAASSPNAAPKKAQASFSAISTLGACHPRPRFPTDSGYTAGAHYPPRHGITKGGTAVGGIAETW